MEISKEENLDGFVREPATEDAENLTLEVVFHFVDKDGNRIRATGNRITIKLQVKEITFEESMMFPMLLNGAVISMIQQYELLHRLVRDPKRVEMLRASGNNTDHTLLGLSCMPQIDCIESLNIRHISRWDAPISDNESPSGRFPDAASQNRLKDSRISCYEGDCHSGTLR